MYTCICDVRVYTRRRVCLLRKTPSSVLGLSSPHPRDRRSHTVYTFLYYIFSIHFPRTRFHTDTHTRTTTNQIVFASFIVNWKLYLRIPNYGSRVRTFHTRAMRIQLRRDDFRSSMKICFRDCPAMQSRHRVYSIPNVEYIFIVNRETHNNVDKYDDWLFLNAV